MKTFLESLNITKNTRLLEQLILKLEYLGIDSNEFLDWYIEEGINLQKKGLLIEGFDDWALREGIWDSFKSRWFGGKSSGQGQDHTDSSTVQRIKNAGERAGQFVHNQGNRVGKALGWARDAYNSFNKGVQGDNSNNVDKHTSNPSVVEKAKEALSNLSKRIQYSKQLQSILGRDNESIIQLLNALQSVKESFDIRNKLIFLKSNGLDVEQLVELFIQEKSNINEGIEDWFGKVGDWFKGQWANVKHAWNTWGDGQEGEAVRRDKQAVDNAMNALQDLQQNSSNNEAISKFKDTINQIIDKINSAKQALNQTGSEPQNKPQSAPQPAQNPGPASAAPGVTGVTVSSTAGTPSNQDGSSQSGWLGSGSNQDGSSQSGWLGNNSGDVQQNYLGKTQMYGRQPKPGVKKPAGGWPNPGTGTTDVGSGVQNSSTNYDSDENKKFLESLLPKSNKFSWFGY